MVTGLTALFWAILTVCLVNIARYFSALRTLLAVLRGCDPQRYREVDGAGFFTARGKPDKQMRLVRYIWRREYLEHAHSEFRQCCERVRQRFILTSVLCALTLLSLLMVLAGVWLA